jgi:hypothetical protein
VPKEERGRRLGQGGGGRRRPRGRGRRLGQDRRVSDTMYFHLAS